jgi:hypothetical protein
MLSLHLHAAIEMVSELAGANWPPPDLLLLSPLLFVPIFGAGASMATAAVHQALVETHSNS